MSWQQLTLFLSYPGFTSTRLGLWSVLPKDIPTHKKKTGNLMRLEPMTPGLRPLYHWPTLDPVKYVKGKAWLMTIYYGIACHRKQFPMFVGKSKSKFFHKYVLELQETLVRKKVGYKKETVGPCTRSLTKTSAGFYVSAVEVFWKHCGKRRNCSFLLFTLCFLLVWRTFCPLHPIRNCLLQSLSVWKILKFVIWEKVKNTWPFPAFSLSAFSCRLSFIPFG